MKRLGNLWQRVVSFDNLLLAFPKARRGKRRRPPAAVFELNLEKELLELQRDLISGDYIPGEYRLFSIYERKPRLIAAAPFRDRVVHHALLNVIEPPLDRRFIFDSYACRAKKGVHAAVTRYQTWARSHAYALKMDIARYFPSVDHDRRTCARPTATGTTRTTGTTTSASVSSIPPVIAPSCRIHGSGGCGSRPP